MTPQEWYNKGVNSIHQGKLVDAMPSFLKAIELKPTFTKAWYRIDSIHLECKEYEEAIYIFKKILKKKKSTYHVWNEEDQEHRDCERCKELKDGEIRYNNGKHNVNEKRINFKRCNYCKRYDEYKNSKINRDYNTANYHAWNAIGQIYLECENFKENKEYQIGDNYKDAKKAFVKAMRHKLKPYAAQNGKGEALAGLNEWIKAKRVFDNVISLFYNNVYARNDIIQRLAKLKKYDKALLYYPSIKRPNPNDHSTQNDKQDEHTKHYLLDTNVITNILNNPNILEKSKSGPSDKKTIFYIPVEILREFNGLDSKILTSFDEPMDDNNLKMNDLESPRIKQIKIILEEIGEVKILYDDDEKTKIKFAIKFQEDKKNEYLNTDGKPLSLVDCFLLKFYLTNSNYWLVTGDQQLQNAAKNDEVSEKREPIMICNLKKMIDIITL